MALVLVVSFAFLPSGTLSVYAKTVPVPQIKPEVIVSSDTDEQTTTLSGLFDIASVFSSADTIPKPARKPSFESAALRHIQSLQDSVQDQKNTLSAKDAELYREIFEFQDEGKMEKANYLLRKLSNPVLLGHVLHQRYMHPTAYRSSYSELKNWLNLYSDHPGADKIYSLAEKRASGNTELKKPASYRGIARVQEPTMRPAKRYESAKKRSNDDIAKLNGINRNIFSSIRSGNSQDALSALESPEHTAFLDPVEFDLLKAEVAASFMYEGDIERAYKLAKEASQRSGLNVPKAGWIGGLTSWQYGRYREAARYFEIAARSPYASGWMLTAGSYWAARAHMRLGNVKAVSSWLRRGVQYPRTFYGLISTRALGHNFDFNWKIPTYTKSYYELLINNPVGFRAIALVKAGQPFLAQAELLRLKPENDEMRDAILAFAGYANLPGLAMRVAGVAENANGASYDAALYPMAPWKPENGYQIEPALLHAIMRQESRFNPLAESPSGAKGLMQLMPSTARYVAGKSAEHMDRPEKNLEIGQHYLQDLLDTSSVDGELLSLLIAYNAGPGNLAKWKKRWSKVRDPLLFIELLPSAETRAYVERVLANYWIYRMRDGQDTPTLDAIAAGKPAQYKGLGS